MDIIEKNIMGGGGGMVFFVKRANNNLNLMTYAPIPLSSLWDVDLCRDALHIHSPTFSNVIALILICKNQ